LLSPLLVLFSLLFFGVGLALFLGLVLGVGLAVCGLILRFWGRYVAVHRAERSKKLRIEDSLEVDTISRLLAHRSRRVFAARLAVVRVASPVWHEAVRGLASVSAAVVVDVSQATDNLVWEVAMLKRELWRRCIVVADGERFMALTEGPERAPDVDRQLLEMLSGEDVLAYSSDRQGRKRFARALRARLEELGAM
jgi:hypothetical protein